MARIEFQDNLEEQIGQLEGLRRGAVKRIVMAGADACAEAEKQAIEEYHHVGKTGSMRENVRPGAYHESMGSGSVNVYPQGEDSKGVGNALKGKRPVGPREPERRRTGRGVDRGRQNLLLRPSGWLGKRVPGQDLA